MKNLICILAFATSVLLTGAAVAQETTRAQRIKAHCGYWNKICFDGCVTNPGSGGVEGCRRQTCGARMKTCENSGCYPFATLGTKCL